MRKSISMAMLLVAVSALATTARANSCYDVAGKGDTSCETGHNEPDAAARPREPATTRTLRDRLKDGMARKRRDEDQAAARVHRSTAAGEALVGSSERLAAALGLAEAEGASVDEGMAAAYADAVRDFQKSEAAYLMTLDPRESRTKKVIFDDQLASARRRAIEAGLLKPPATHRLAPTTARSETFSTCEPAGRGGVERCFEAGRTGLSCRVSLMKSGDEVWSQVQVRCETPDILAMRNAFFNPPASAPAPATVASEEEPSQAAGETRSAPDVDYAEVADGLINFAGALGELGSSLGRSGSNYTAPVRSTNGQSAPVRTPSHYGQSTISGATR